MDFENLFSKPPNPALGKKPAADSEERIAGEVDGAEVEETHTEKVKWKAKRDCEQVPKKVRFNWHVGQTALEGSAKQKNKKSKAGNKKVKQKKMKRKWPGTGNKGSSVLLKNSGSQEKAGEPEDKQPRVRMSQGFINQHTVERKGKQVCKYFLERKCIKGDQCKFDHDAEIEKKKEMCKYYVQGYCTKGENCLYLHNILYHKIPFPLHVT
ncbi:hypothetical protein A6R68_18823 [Neotoma lepida]|uniref:C3H1-type domain-containing protein n=1 Tax=Neotoma lepida TaxID=56216 RepID=A0A1A6HJN0_NEOLE|nr:hypothetical protein A6R68_18823 [Neotoma lepida]